MKNIIAFQDFSYLYRNQPKPNREKEEFRLLRIIHNVDTRKIELVCYKFDSIIIAVMPELFYDRVKPLIDKTIGLEFERKEIGNHQILMINQIILLESAKNPLMTPLPTWIALDQKGIYSQFLHIVAELEPKYQSLMLEVFRNDELLSSFLNLPASLAHHHNRQGGLFKHSVDVALDCLHSCLSYPNINRSLTVTSALLHDIGKTEEYIAGKNGRFSRSTTGMLLMHKLSGASILAIAAHTSKIDKRLVHEVTHCISACHAPAFAGLPYPKMAESIMVQTADARSSGIELYESEHHSVSNLTSLHA